MKKFGKVAFPAALMVVLAFGVLVFLSPTAEAGNNDCPSLICPTNLSGWTAMPLCEIYDPSTDCYYYYENYSLAIPGTPFSRTCRVLEDTGIYG